MEYRKQQFQTYEEFIRQFPCDYSMPFARGGHGELYRGIDAETNDEVAIKRRLYSVGDDFLSLEKEYTNTQEVPANRFVVRYLYYGRYATPFGTYEYLVMRYYRDGNLTSQVLPWHQLTEPLQRRFVEEFLLGLEHLHTHHIIHRDVKPENVLLVRYTDNGQPAYRPVLADFGISKVLTDHPEIARTLVQNSMRVGTVTYMAPEQLRGNNVTYNSDLWSLGVILYEIITGKHMIARRSFPEQQREEAYGFWRDVDDGRLPDDLSTVAQPYQEIIRQCLIVNPRSRVKRAADLINLLIHTQTTPAQVSAGGRPTAHSADAPVGRIEAALTEQLDDSPPTTRQRPSPLPSPSTQTSRPAQGDQPVVPPNRAVPASQLTELFDLPTVGQAGPVHRPEPQPIKAKVDVKSPTVEKPIAPVEQPHHEEILDVAVVPTPVERVQQPVELVQAEPVQAEPVQVLSEPIKTESVQTESVQPETPPIDPIQFELVQPESVPVELISDEAVQDEPVQTDSVLTESIGAVSVQAIPVPPPVELVQPPAAETSIPLEKPVPMPPAVVFTPPDEPVVRPAKPIKPAKQRVPNVRTPKPARSLRPFIKQARQTLTRSAVAAQQWGQTRLIPEATVAFTRASRSITRASDALSRQPWLNKLMLQGWVMVVLTVLVYSSGPDVHVATVVAQPTVKQSESYQIARQRFNQAQILYKKTGALDTYLWTFIHCNPTFEDSLMQSVIHRSDTLLLSNQRLFPNYKGNLSGLKRQEMKRIVRNKISWESKPHDADELSCQPQQP